ncbi:MAG: DNA starvation/stationary phase protection protein [Fimbriimonas sp.]|nr:DNA starvation/stationary phase protection protein [Fimbriimonas sp.]
MAIAEQNELFNATLATVDGRQRETNHKALQPILYDLIALGRVLKQLHWNVVGPSFRSIHLHLDEIYATVDGAVDEVAERIAATGHSPNGRMRDVFDNTEIEDVPVGFLRDSDVLVLAEHAVRRVVDFVRVRTQEIEQIDTATADMLHKIALDLEKHHWMLAAQRIDG